MYFLLNLINKKSIEVNNKDIRIQDLCYRPIKGKGCYRPSRIIFLTARADFDNRDEFLSAFEEYGIPMKDKNLVYVARTGNMKTGTIAERKRDVILKYLDSGLYRRCRMIDDDLRNLQFFNHLAQNHPEEIKEKVREKYNLNSEEEPIKFYPLLVKESGELQYLAT